MSRDGKLTKIYKFKVDEKNITHKFIIFNHFICLEMVLFVCDLLMILFLLSFHFYYYFIKRFYDKIRKKEKLSKYLTNFCVLLNKKENYENLM